MMPEKPPWEKYSEESGPWAKYGEPETSVPVSSLQASQSGGFWPALKQDILGAGASMLTGIPGMAYQAGKKVVGEYKSYVDTGKSLEQQQYEQRRQAGYSPAYSLAAAPAAEALGVNVPAIEQAAAQGDTAGIAGHLVVPSVMAASPLLAKGIGLAKGANKIALARPEIVLAERGIKNLSEALGTAPGKGGIKAAAMDSDLITVMRDLSAISRNAPKVKGAEGLHQFAEHIEAKQQEMWNQGHMPGILRNPNLIVDTPGLVKAGESAVSKMAARVNPPEAKAAKAWLDESVAPGMNLQELDQFIRETNADLKGKDSLAAYGPIGVRVRQAAVRAARTEVDRLLESAGETGIKELNRRWGALENIKTRTQERAVYEAGREAKKGPVPDWVHLYSFLHPTAAAIPISVGAGIRIGAMFNPTPMGKFIKGINMLAKANLNPPPYAAAPPSPRIAGLLGTGALVTPPRMEPIEPPSGFPGPSWVDRQELSPILTDRYSQEPTTVPISLATRPGRLLPPNVEAEVNAEWLRNARKAQGYKKSLTKKKK